MKILDACAAPGGKLIALHQLLKQRNVDAHFFATEAKFKRLERLKENIKRWNLDSKIQTALYTWGDNPESDYPESDFDLILADLPCTGTGTLHTRPDLLLEDISSRVTSLELIQTRILNSLIPRLSAGGKLAVSLCSVDPAELKQVDQALRHFNCETFTSFDSDDQKIVEGITAMVATAALR